MKFDFGLEELWDKKNREIQDKIQLNPLSSVRTYPGISHALSEMVRGLIQLFPHRKSFAVLRGSGPFFEELSNFAGMEGLVRTELTVRDLQDPNATLAKIPKDCLFVLGSYDDPFTAEVFPFETLFESLHKNRCFTIGLSHSVHLARGFLPISQYMATVGKIPNQGAFALLGQRTSKIQRLTLGHDDWFVPEYWVHLFANVSELKNEILDFERKLPKYFVPFFDQDANRCYDRAVIRALEFDSEACIRLLAEELKLVLAAPGQDPTLEALSLCRWHGIHTFDWYVHQGRKVSDMRGVVLIDRQLINATTLQALETVGQRLTELQT